MMNAGWCNNHLETYEFVNGKDDIPYMKWKIIQSCLKPPTRLDIVGMMSKKMIVVASWNNFGTWQIRINDLASDNGTQAPHRIFWGLACGNFLQFAIEAMAQSK